VFQKLGQFDLPGRHDVGSPFVILPDHLRLAQVRVAAAGQDGCDLFTQNIGRGRRERILIRRLDEKPLFGLFPARGFIRTRCQRPCKRCPRSSNSRWPFCKDFWA
jgi:hypothetical protein